jgi:hypothetical protein
MLLDQMFYIIYDNYYNKEIQMFLKYIDKFTKYSFVISTLIVRYINLYTIIHIYIKHLLMILLMLFYIVEAFHFFLK